MDERGVQTLAYCFINSSVELLGFLPINSTALPSDEVVNSPIGNVVGVMS